MIVPKSIDVVFQRNLYCPERNLRLARETGVVQAVEHPVALH
jgi:hypothetical protein